MKASVPVLAPQLHALMDRRLRKDGDVVMHEFDLHSSIADIFVVQADELLVGYEIKSERDSLARLATQVPVYDRVLDRCWLVVADRLCAASLKKLPAHWGVLRVTRPGGVRLVLERDAAENPARDPLHVTYLLWVTELREIMQRFNPQRSSGRWGKHEVCDKVLQIDPTVLRHQVAIRLRARRGDRDALQKLKAESRRTRLLHQARAQLDLTAASPSWMQPPGKAVA